MVSRRGRKIFQGGEIYHRAYIVIALESPKATESLLIADITNDVTDCLPGFTSIVDISSCEVAGKHVLYILTHFSLVTLNAETGKTMNVCSHDSGYNVMQVLGQTVPSSVERLVGAKSVHVLENGMIVITQDCFMTVYADYELDVAWLLPVKDYQIFLRENHLLRYRETWSQFDLIRLRPSSQLISVTPQAIWNHIFSFHASPWTVRCVSQAFKTFRAQWRSVDVTQTEKFFAYVAPDEVMCVKTKQGLVGRCGRVFNAASELIILADRTHRCEGDDVFMQLPSQARTVTFKSHCCVSKEAHPYVETLNFVDCINVRTPLFASSAPWLSLKSLNLILHNTWHDTNLFKGEGANNVTLFPALENLLLSVHESVLLKRILSYCGRALKLLRLTLTCKTVLSNFLEVEVVAESVEIICGKRCSFEPFFHQLYKARNQQWKPWPMSTRVTTFECLYCWQSKFALVLESFANVRHLKLGGSDSYFGQEIVTINALSFLETLTLNEHSLGALPELRHPGLHTLELLGTAECKDVDPKTLAGLCIHTLICSAAFVTSDFALCLRNHNTLQRVEIQDNTFTMDDIILCLRMWCQELLSCRQFQTLVLVTGQDTTHCKVEFSPKQIVKALLAPGVFKLNF